MNRAIIYARVSTEEQAKRGYSLDFQLNACRKYAAEHGLEVVAEYSEDHTGTVVSRPEFDKVRALAGTFDVLIVWIQDRLGRVDALETWNLIRSFQDKGTNVHTTDTGFIDVSDFMKALVTLVKAEGIKEERAKIIKRTKAGRRAAAEMGQKVTVTRVGKYGYDYNRDKRTLEINELEAEIVRKIYHWYISGDERGKRTGATAIAHKLTEMGIPTKADLAGARKKKGYGVWGSSSVLVILKDETYCGRWTYGRRENGRQTDRSGWIGVKVPAIVDRATWEAAQARARENIQTSPRNTQREYLMRGLLRCAVCGLQFVCSFDKRLKIPHGVYSCGGQRARGSIDGLTHTCRGDLNQTEIDVMVWDAVAAMLKNPENALAGIRQRQADKEAALQPERDSLERFRMQLRKFEGMRQDVLGLYLERKHDKAWLDSNLNQIERNIASAQDKIADLEKRLIEVELESKRAAELEAFSSGLRDNLDDFNFDQRRLTLELLDTSGIIQRGAKLGEFTISLSGFFPGIQIQPGFTPTFAYLSGSKPIPFFLTVRQSSMRGGDAIADS